MDLSIGRDPVSEVYVKSILCWRRVLVDQKRPEVDYDGLVSITALSSHGHSVHMVDSRWRSAAASINDQQEPVA
jgi:hypothetical protein